MDTVSDTLAAPAPRVDPEVVSRFATCCRALGLSVHDRRRPADLSAARTGFSALTRAANDQCDAWTGLDAAGEVSPRVIEAVWQTSATAGALQREIGLAPDALGFHYDTGLYLRFRATSCDEFTLAAGYADADQIVGRLLDRRPGWLQARWVRVAIHYRTGRWADVVRLLTPVVADESLEATYAHAARITLGIALARLGMFAPALSHLERPEGPIAVAAVDGTFAKVCRCAHRVTMRMRWNCCRSSTPRTRKAPRSRTPSRIRPMAFPPPPRPASRPAATRGIPRPSRGRPTSWTPAPRTVRHTCSSRQKPNSSSSASTKSIIRSLA